ncbi:collagenase-like [Epargyreus clarus]|uniref:collagenase-like n=1 Tax=Epargyreus clarus TaxID=520877 RepID=UPI003C2D3B6D
MKFIVVLLALATFSSADITPPDYAPNTAYGYLERYGIPAAERIRKAEEEFLNNPARIIGGVPAGLGQYPYHAGLISDIIGTTSRGVCGASLISNMRVLTAAHCWNDGRHQAWKFTVVLGSTRLFSGGTRVESSVVAMHGNWNPLFATNDIAVIYLPNAVATSANVAPIALPSGSQVNENFVDSLAVAVGFGVTSNDANISENNYLNHVRLRVISNNACSLVFPLVLRASHICTSGIGGVGPCRGDSGGPLALNINNTPVLIGVSSFISNVGCDGGLPAGFSRVTSFLAFINQHNYVKL